MSRTPIQLLLIYFAVQTVPFLIIELFLPEEYLLQGTVYGSLAAFVIGAIWMIWLSNKKDYQTSVELEDRNEKAGHPILWGVIGLFMALFAQYLASIIEVSILGIQPESVNTQSLVLVAKEFPLFILSVAVFGPIMEEYIFRKVIFGTLYDRIGGVGAAVVSSLIFAFIHIDGHLLVYSSMGFVFSYLYYKTKNITAPIIAHSLMNGIAVLLQFSLIEGSF